jgi:hypothetical protein
LKRRPNGVSSGKTVWHAEQESPVCRANPGVAFALDVFSMAVAAIVIPITIANGHPIATIPRMLALIACPLSRGVSGVARA